jgi:hypothetical protein
MNSKYASLVLRIDSILMFASGLGFFLWFRPLVTIFLPDVTPSLIPRWFGAARIGLAMILWAMARDPEGLRDIIPGVIVARALDLVVLWPMMLIAHISMPAPFGLPAVLVWGLGTIAAFIILGMEGLFWFNTRPKKQ